jgi:hypothetical protein
MSFVTKLARGLGAAIASVGSDSLGEGREFPLESGGTLRLEPRRRRPDGPDLIRIETPLGEGLARIDLTAADARMLAADLLAYADAAAGAAARPVEAKRIEE